jgi:hypothetical protein
MSLGIDAGFSLLVKKEKLRTRNQQPEAPSSFDQANSAFRIFLKWATMNKNIGQLRDSGVEKKQRTRGGGMGGEEE